MEKILSVIIPAYNMEKYINECVESFIGSTYFNDIEILIVNDGSKDNTLNIAMELCENYPQSIRVIDKENGGHGSAINCGTSQCLGKYFKVVDADDWVDTKEFDKLVGRLFEIDVDCVICNYSEYFESKNETKLVDVTSHVLQDSVMSIYDFVKLKRLAMHSVTYKTKTYRSADIKLRERCYYVDTEFIYFPLKTFNTLICYSFNVYQYRLQREGQSVSREGFIKNIKDHRKVIIDLCEFYNAFPSEKKELKKFLALEIGIHLTYQQTFLINISVQKQEWKDYKDFIKQIKKTYLPIYKTMSSKRRLVHCLGISGIRFLAKIGLR